MKKILISLLFILLINISFSQVKTGKLIYSINVDKLYTDAINNNKTEKTIKISKLVAKAAKDIEFVLFFDNNISIFKEIEKLSIGGELEHNLKIMARTYSSDALQLTDLNQKIQVISRNYSGETFHVKKPIKKRNWTLTRETKKIGAFTCYKATYIKAVPKGDILITAWYTPEIPAAFGPDNYVGDLPGLILELHDIIATYKCTSIELNPKKPIEIKWPKDSEIISEEAYKKEGEKINKILKERG